MFTFPDCGIDCSECPKEENCELVAKPDNFCPHNDNCEDCAAFIDGICQIEEFEEKHKKDYK